MRTAREPQPLCRRCTPRRFSPAVQRYPHCPRAPRPRSAPRRCPPSPFSPPTRRNPTLGPGPARGALGAQRPPRGRRGSGLGRGPLPVPRPGRPGGGPGAEQAPDAVGPAARPQFLPVPSARRGPLALRSAAAPCRWWRRPS